jgi:hypothetical protein
VLPVGDAVGVAAGDDVAGAVAVAVGATAGDDVAGVAAGAVGATAVVGAVLGVDVLEVMDEVMCPDTDCPECASVVGCMEAARATPPAADAASSPTSIAAIVSGLASRRR